MNLDKLKNLGQFTRGGTYYVNPIGHPRYSESIECVLSRATGPIGWKHVAEGDLGDARTFDLAFRIQRV